MSPSPSSSLTSRTTSLNSGTPISTLHHHTSLVPFLPHPLPLLSSHPRRNLHPSWFALVLPWTSTLGSTLGNLRIRLGPCSLPPLRFPWSMLISPWRISESPRLLAGGSPSGSSLRHGPRPSDRGDCIPLYPLTVHICMLNLVCILLYMVPLLSLCCLFFSIRLILSSPSWVPDRCVPRCQIPFELAAIYHTTITKVSKCTIP